MKTDNSFNHTKMYITIQKFVRAKSFSGIILFTAAIIAMLIANSPFSHYYFLLLESNFFIGFLDFLFSMDMKQWVNDGLMTIFFLLAGLEIKREISVGELSSLQLASFPFFGALGGMFIPAIIYLIINQNGHTEGFGIPMATDIAFALGILLLLGKRIPLALKLFLITLAVIDDLGAVIVIALFYTQSLNLTGIFLSLITLTIMITLNRQGVKALLPYILLGFILWYGFHISGVHASIAGILVALVIPVKSTIESSSFIKRLKFCLKYFENLDQTRSQKLLTHKQVDALDIMGDSYDSVQSPLVRLENKLIPISAFLVMPIFAFFNAGITLSSVTLSIFHPVSLGIILGLSIGKPLGIFGTVYFADRFGFAKKPDSLGWMDIFGASILGGVGFTMSIFVSDIAFGNPDLINLAKLSIILSSMISGLLGAIWLFKTISTHNIKP